MRRTLTAALTAALTLGLGAAPAEATDYRPVGKVVRPYYTGHSPLMWHGSAVVTARPKGRAPGTLTGVRRMRPLVTWKPVTPTMAEVLSEGDDTPPMNADTRRWEDCVWKVAGVDSIIVRCKDGVFRPW